MDNKEFSRKLEERTKQFAIDILKYCALLSNTPEGRMVRNQLSKAGCSIGANYREANRARSKAEFKSKIKISEGESSETVYWLEIIEKLEWVDDDRYKPLIVEAKEVLAISTSISNKL